ncbi:flagellar biosynthesis anti-sigma factor FlgM [candidate division KSB1 bacterium]
MEIQRVSGELDPVKAGRTRGVRRDPAAPVSSKDTVEISKEAQELQQVKEITARLPEVRDDRVTQVRQRVESGYYNRVDVRGSVVEELIDHFGLPG